MNGTVECQRCEYSDQFVNVLAFDMCAADPVPESFVVPRKEHHALPRELLEQPSWWRELFDSLGVHWRAAARHMRGPEERPRRLARAHSTIGW